MNDHPKGIKTLGQNPAYRLACNFLQKKGSTVNMKKKSNFTAPFLKKITFELPEEQNAKDFPFSIPLFRKNFTVNFSKPIVIITGDNGSGKSTLLETIAHTCGFNIQGGSRDHTYQTHERESL